MSCIPRYLLIDGALDHGSRTKHTVRTLATFVLQTPCATTTEDLAQRTEYNPSWIQRHVRYLNALPGFEVFRDTIVCADRNPWVWPTVASAPEEDVNMYQKILDDVPRRRVMRERTQRRADDASYGEDDSYGTYSEEGSSTSEYENYQHLVDEALTARVTDPPPPPPAPVVDREVAAILEAPESCPVTLRVAASKTCDLALRCVKEAQLVRRNLEMIRMLNADNALPHDTMTPYFDAHQRRLDESVAGFLQSLSEQTGYRVPQVRASCPICLDVVRKPCCMDCGHVACMDCLCHPSNPRFEGDKLVCPLCKNLGGWRRMYIDAD
jgi:hypothetical protein